MIYNGEVYNYAAIRQDLASLGHAFSSDSDSEVVLHAYQEWGPGCLERFNGMFSFAILDRRQGRLFCARDRFGIKPFYYAMNRDGFVFASEIKALFESGLVTPAPNLPILYTYLCSSTDDIRETFYEGIVPLQPGHCLIIDLEAKKLVTECYYSLPRGKDKIKLTSDDFAEGFLERFSQAVRYRLIADVPVGTCLSGGLDSSAIVCMVDKLMRDDGLKIVDSDLQSTFSARYQDPRHDEGEWIEAVVAATGCRVHTTYPTGAELVDELDAFIWHHEEPLGSTSCYAQWRVFKLVKDSHDAGVKVTLDGQGGDEVLGGYHRYFASHFANLLAGFQLGRLRREMNDCAAIHGYSQRALAYQIASIIVPSGLKARLRKLSNKPEYPNWMNHSFGTRFAQHPDVARRRGEYFDWSTGNVFEGDLYRSVSFGIPRLLRHADRNSMAHSIESRVPFLDHELVEFCFAMPDEHKISRGTTKVALRDSMKGLMPDPVRLRHSKIGFSTPQDAWFRNALSPVLEDVVQSESFADRGYVDVDRARSLFAQHKNNEVDINTDLWKWTNLELWMRRYVD
jgi:asparagine synthase (glutamine-hydrolysing)